MRNLRRFIRSEGESTELSRYRAGSRAVPGAGNTSGRRGGRAILRRRFSVLSEITLITETPVPRKRRSNCYSTRFPDVTRENARRV